MSIEIDIRQLPQRWEEALAQATLGKEVILTYGALPRARLIPVIQRGTWKLGLHPAAYDIAPDFDEPLPDEFWLGES